ncbi:MAG: hypothetical protein ACREA9_21085 [Pyrinomonadaceae bacterium]
MARNELLLTVREFIRQDHAFPGGYPLVLVMTDGGGIMRGMREIELQTDQRINP